MTEFRQEFPPLEIEDIHSHAQSRKDEGWRYVQMLAVNTDEGIDLIYSFMKDGFLENNVVKGVTKENVIPSISDIFIEAFVFENETHDLFGVNIQNIAIDFHGLFYSLSVDEPMTIMTPEEFEERKAARLSQLKQNDKTIEIEEDVIEEENGDIIEVTEDAPVDQNETSAEHDGGSENISEKEGE